MKITNIILSIIILLLAIALAVSSFFLYEKREIMINGWEKLTAAINKTAQELDKNSGTKTAETLTQDALAHTNYATLDDKLKELDRAAANLIQQRDRLASTLITVADILESQNVPASDKLTNIETSEKSAKEIVQSAETFKARRDAVINSLARSGRLIGVNINVKALKDGKSNEVFKAFDDKIKSLLSQISTYQRLSREIGSIAGTSSRDMKFDVNNYTASLNKIKKSVSDLKAKYNKSQSDLARSNRTIKQQEGTIASKNRAISKLESEKKDHLKNIKDLRRALGVGEKEEIKIWEKGSKEARLAVKGKIIEINKKYGFYVIDIGNNTVVTQKIGVKSHNINPKLEPNMSMTIARNMDSPEVKFVAKAKITNVADDCSIIELANDPNNSNTVMVGDDVYFATADLK